MRKLIFAALAVVLLFAGPAHAQKYDLTVAGYSPGGLVSTVGAGQTFVVLIFIAYNLFGHLLSGVLKHGYIDTVHFIDIMV